MTSTPEIAPDDAPGRLAGTTAIVADRARWQGYMNGALESGLRAAHDVAAAVRPL